MSTLPDHRLSKLLPNSTDKLNLLLMGGGGREHAIASKLITSPRLGKLWITHPENPALAALASPVDVPVHIREFYRLEQFCEKKNIDLVIIGPEDPLAEGFADKFAQAGIAVFGPSREGARLEWDKAWAKQVMRSAAVPTAEARSFTDPNAAIAYIESREQAQVVKASGLAKGKGVIVPASSAEAVAAVKRIMVERVFGDAGSTVVIEERLSGPEVSLLAIVDGRNILILPPCQDHKRLRDNDEGPNTGGMGAFCPASTLDDATLAKIEREILVPTVDALRRDNIPYVGVLYVGLMLTPAGPKVIEFNCRFGDPECQPLMARLRTDLLTILAAACAGTLHEIDVEWDPRTACCVVLASDGYPEKPRLGVPIFGVDDASRIPNVHVFHAGTRINPQGQLVTGGGRVLGVTALGDTLDDARKAAYAACDKIVFDGKAYRTDIGAVTPPSPRKRSAK
jgi:phosphoribosylamine--glycine ligase